MEVTIHKRPSLTRIFIGKKPLTNCTGFNIHMDVKNPATFEIEVTGFPTFSNNKSKGSKPFIFR